ncbi:MAG: ring-opening amidohydrolase [Hyphomicrobiaceae bacterium]|nr:ring-opening amidohydrolase [Hyphomicrobiaceae bacterium]
MRRAFIHRFAMRAPDDTSLLEAALIDGTVDPRCVVAILGKTEGNGCVNDFTRAFAVRSIEGLLERYAPGCRPAIVTSGGTEGALSPHMLVFEVRASDEAGRGKSLALGTAHTADLPPDMLGRIGQVCQVADGVRAAMADAGIADPADVHYVQIKCPLLTIERIEQALARGKVPAVRDTLKSMAWSRGASALGVAVAMGEISLAEISDAMICQDMTLYSTVAATSGGVELLGHEIMVAGMSSAWAGPLAIDHAVMEDAIDVEPVRQALSRLGLAATGQLPAERRLKVRAVMAKAEAPLSGKVRGLRHTMLDDSDIASTRHARAFVGGVLAGLFGFTDLFVSGGAEHQGPDGGGPVAIVVERA